MSFITTHVLDLSSGKPASKIPVTLEIREAKQGWRLLGSGETDQDGRANDLLAGNFRLIPGTYRLSFQVSRYFRAQKVESFFPEASILFTVNDTSQHYHVPLLLSPHGYTTYRGG